MALQRNQGGYLVKLKSARRASELRKKTPSALKRVAPAVARSRGLDRSRGRSQFFDDGRVKDHFTFAVDSVLIWLNGWQTVEDELAYTPRDQRERLAEMYKSHNVTRIGAEDHTPEAQARIENLLRCVQEIRSRIQAIDREQNYVREDTDVVALSEIDRAMKRYVTYPTLSLHVKSGNFAIFQKTLESEHHALVPLTHEERRETDPRKRRHYSVGPGKTLPKSTPEEDAVIRSVHALRGQTISTLSAGDQAILAGYNRRVAAAATHKWRAPETPYGEIAAAHAIIDLARLGAIDNVRKCSVCRIWFYAKKVNQVGCGDPKCRRERDKQTPGYKEALAAKVQRNREKRELAVLSAERKRILRVAKGKISENEAARIEAIEAKIADLKRSIRASEKLAAENKAKGRRERRASAIPLKHQVRKSMSSRALV